MTTVQNAAHIYKSGPSINVLISDFILTPVACAVLVNEVMKNLLYHRSQIPYPYSWLKSIVTKKRRSLEEAEENAQKHFTLNKHYQIVSKTYDSAENVMADLIKVFTHDGSRLKEVVFVIGVTPFSPKEVFTIKISSLAHGHVERNHVIENSKKQPKILRCIFLENSWMDLIEKSLSCSNTYIFLKLSGIDSFETRHDENTFKPCKPLIISSSVKHTIINFNYVESEQFSCCDKLEVFNDSCDVNNPSSTVKIKQVVESNTEIWLQSNILVQGFKDCFVNKVSACELW